ncbi:MAG: helix-turn-helix domain-containing protein [Arenimonas sp.]|jgi:cytoskeleton protein RodZ
MDPIQNPLFREPIGMTFRAKRELLDLTVEDAAKALKFGTHLIEAIEHEEWHKLGAPIYAKSYINSYIKLLGLSEDIRNEIPGMTAVPQLKAITYAKIEPARRSPKWLLAAISLIAVAALVAYLNLRQSPSEALSLDALVDQPVIPENQAIQAAVAIEGQSAAPAPAPAQSTTETPPTPANVSEMLIRSSQQSWVEVRGKDGSVLFSGTLGGTADFRQDPAKVGKITIGNASSAEISLNGARLDISPLIRDEVARFTLSDDGKPVPADSVPTQTLPNE